MLNENCLLILFHYWCAGLSGSVEKQRKKERKKTVEKGILPGKFAHVLSCLINTGVLFNHIFRVFGSSSQLSFRFFSSQS